MEFAYQQRVRFREALVLGIGWWREMLRKEAASKMRIGMTVSRDRF